MQTCLCQVILIVAQVLHKMWCSQSLDCSMELIWGYLQQHHLYGKVFYTAIWSSLVSSQKPGSCRVPNLLHRDNCMFSEVSKALLPCFVVIRVRNLGPWRTYSLPSVWFLVILWHAAQANPCTYMVNRMQPFIPISCRGLFLILFLLCKAKFLVETNASPFYLINVILWNAITFFVVVLFFLTETDISPCG